MKYIKNSVTGEVRHVSNEQATELRRKDARWSYISKFAGREKLGRPKEDDAR